MKKFLLGFISCLSLMSPAIMKGQSFNTTADTVRGTITGTELVYNNITVPGASPVTVTWHIAATDFPADWLSNSALGICDNNICRNNTNDTLLWRVATSTPGGNFTCTYTPGGSNTFDYSPNMGAGSGVTSSGTHYLSVYMTDGVPLGTSKTLTFVISRGTTSTPTINKAGEDNVILYPNPANGEVNVVYDANADVKSVAIYNIIGKMMTVYKVNGNSANLNIENVPAGIYFMKLYNSKGNVVVTRKFTKQ